LSWRSAVSLTTATAHSSRYTVHLVLALFGLLFQTPSGYVVTAEPLAVSASAKLCIAVDATEQRIWWWESRIRSCATRTTGPDVFRAENAAVTNNGDVLRVSFDLPLHGRSGDPTHLQVRLVIENGQMRSLTSDAAVPTLYRADLNIPARYGR